MSALTRQSRRRLASCDEFGFFFFFLLLTGPPSFFHSSGPFPPSSALLVLDTGGDGVDSRSEEGFKGL